MRARQVLHVDVVADAGAVGRVVVVAEDGERRRAAERGVDRARDQVLLGSWSSPRLPSGWQPAALK